MFKVIYKNEEMVREARRLKGLKPRTVLQAFGAWMLGSVAENFRAQGRPEKWKALKFETLKARFMRGNRRRKNKRWVRTPAAMRFFAGAKILMDSGRLANSIGFAVKGNQVEIGTNLIYAATHQFGDKKRNIPARPFLVFQDRDVEEFAGMIEDWMMGE